MKDDWGMQKDNLFGLKKKHKGRKSLWGDIKSHAKGFASDVQRVVPPAFPSKKASERYEREKARVAEARTWGVDLPEPKRPKTPIFSETPLEGTKRIARNLGERQLARIEKRRPRISVPKGSPYLIQEKPSKKKTLGRVKKNVQTWGAEDITF